MAGLALQGRRAGSESERKDIMGTKQIQVSGELWQEICTVGWRATLECTEGLPEGATFCGASFEHVSSASELRRLILVLAFEHPDWPEVELGEDVPVIKIVHERTYDDLGL